MILNANITRSYTVCLAICLVGIVLCGYQAKAQQRLPHPVKLYAIATQGLNFGAFTVGASGGTLSMSPTGSRSTTGDVVALGLGVTYSPAMFQIEADPGTVLGILNGPDVTLTGSGGGTLSLHLGTTNPAMPVITTVVPPALTTLTIGGTLTVGTLAANPPGSYSGYFFITIIRE